MSASLLNRTMVNGSFFRRYAESARRELVSRLALMPSSSGASERYAFGTGAPEASLWVGPRKTKAIQAVYKDIVNYKWESSIEYEADDLRRDQTGSINRRTAELADRMAIMQWRLVADMIRNNTAAAYDGQVIFSASHSFGSSGTQSNLLTSSEVGALNVGTATAPTPEEMVDAFMGVFGYMMGYLDEEGTPFLEDASNWLILCAPNLYGATKAAVSANNLAGGETNVVTNGGINVEVAIARRCYASGSSADFYVVNLDGMSDPPFIVQEELATELAYWDESSDFYKDNDKFKVGGKWIGGAGPGEPLRIAKCTLS